MKRAEKLTLDIGRAIAITVLVLVVAFVAVWLTAGAWLTGLTGCDYWRPGEYSTTRAADDLDLAVAGLPGVLESDIQLTTNCWTVVDTSVTFHASATVDEVGEVTRHVARALHRPEFGDVGISSRFSFEGVPQIELRGLSLNDQARALPVEHVVTEARAWAQLSRQYPDSAVVLEDRIVGNLERRVEIRLPGDGAPGAVTEAFRALERAAFPPLDGVAWHVETIREADYPYYGTSYRTPGSAPPGDVLAAMEDISGWPALLAQQDDMTVMVEWVPQPADGAPPHLSVEVSLALAELAHVPNDRLADAVPASAAPRLGAAFLDRIKATGVPYSIKVIPVFLTMRSWQPS